MKKIIKVLGMALAVLIGTGSMYGALTVTDNRKLYKDMRQQLNDISNKYSIDNLIAARDMEVPLITDEEFTALKRLVGSIKNQANEGKKIVNHLLTAERKYLKLAKQLPEYNQAFVDEFNQIGANSLALATSATDGAVFVLLNGKVVGLVDFVENVIGVDANLVFPDPIL